MIARMMILALVSPFLAKSAQAEHPDSAQLMGMQTQARKQNDSGNYERFTHPKTEEKIVAVLREEFRAGNLDEEIEVGPGIFWTRGKILETLSDKRHFRGEATMNGDGMEFRFEENFELFFPKKILNKHGIAILNDVRGDFHVVDSDALLHWSEGALQDWADMEGGISILGERIHREEDVWSLAAVQPERKSIPRVDGVETPGRPWNRWQAGFRKRAAELQAESVRKFEEANAKLDEGAKKARGENLESLKAMAR